MAEPIGPRITGIEHKAEEIKRAVESIGNRNSGNSHVRIDAGGIGAWAAVTAAIVCFLVAVMTGFMYLDLRREQQRTQDHISVIYQLIPDLRQMVNKELCQQGKVTCKSTEK